MSRVTRVLETRGKRFLLGSRTWLMGVVNVTPDSFSDGGLFLDRERAVRRGLELAADGADIIDVGGESTRPGSLPVPEEEELDRVIPVITELRPRTEALISVDTSKAAVAAAAVEAGADIINDVSALRADPNMAGVVAASGAGLVIMHMKGTPRTMQLNPEYKDVLAEVRDFLEVRISAAEAAGIPRERIIVDPGIGFGKNLEHNLDLIARQDRLREVGRPLLMGISRKSFLGRILGLPPEERLEGTIAVSVLCVLKGADILRVHDVKQVARAVKVAEAVLEVGRGATPGARTMPAERGTGHAG